MQTRSWPVRVWLGAPWASGGIGIHTGLRNRLPSGLRVRVSPRPPTIRTRRVWVIGSPAVSKTAAPQGHRSSNLLPSATFTSGCSWESSLTPNQAHGVRILIPVPRRARQMVSQHIAKVPSARARLGSIPRLSAKPFGKFGCQADTVGRACL